ncbi:ABC transporter substrate-binding protein [Leucobacter iarius]|uniref:ABC transporter substrate-binding protein n=1 Tax=Leucobacter iarius TaxID=333963 RepID=A0ABN2LIW9_9MICO
MSSTVLRRGALGLAAAGVALALAACGSPAAHPGAPAPSADRVVTSTPKPVGDVDSITWAVTSEPASMDWIYNADNSTGSIMANVCEGLFRLSPEMTPEPALAEKVETPNPTTRVYTLRDGVKFHDGTPLTAADVVFSLKRNLDPELGSYWAGPFAHVKSITATGPLEVTIALTEPDALLDSALSSPAGIVDRAQTVQELGKAYGTPKGGINCVGPFSLEKWDSGQSITLKRDPDYFDAAGRARAKQIVFQFVRDPAALTNGLLAGSIDGTWDLAPAAVKRLSQGGPGTVYHGPSTQGYNAIVMDPKGPLQDPVVRQAVSRAIDRSAIITAAVGGAAQEQRAPAVPGTWGYEQQKFRSAWDGIELGQTDLAAAKQLLGTTKTPTKPIVIASTTAEAQTPIIAAEIQSALKKLGLEAEIRNIPADQYYAVYTDPKARTGIDLYLTAWGTDYADPTQIYQYFTTGNFYNFSGYSNPAYDALVAKAAATDDLSARADAIIAAQKIIVEQSLWIPIYAPDNTVFLNKRITGTPTSYMQLHRPWAAALGAAK